MIKAFSILWLAVFVPITLLIFPTSINPIQQLNESFSESFFKQIYGVSLDILSEKLLSQPNDQWETTIQEYAQQFAYPLKLEPMKNYQFDENLHRSISQGEISFLFGDPMALIQRVGKSDQVIYFALNESTELAVLNQAKGTLYLAAEHLRSSPKNEWDDNLAKQNSRIPFQITLKTQADLSNEAKQALTETTQQAVSYINANGQVELLSSVEPGVWLHVHDDMSQATQLKLTTAISVLFFMFISSALFLWIYPLSRDLKRLVATATEFGEGVLSKRAKASKMSVVSQLSSSFNKMADNIENLIASQRELTNAVAHDLRTPLYRLRFALEMLEDDKTSTSQKAKYTKTIHSSIEDLDHLINQNLLLSRYNRVADLNHFTTCCFSEHLLDEVDFYKLEHPHLNVRFYCSPDLKEQQLFVDNKGLMRAVKNLLSNASRFTESQVVISFQSDQGRYKITVEDDGIGVPKAFADRIFEPFAQLDNKERSSDKGHGLGLAIVKQIMNWHDGSASVSDSSLGGAKFEVSWPITFTKPNHNN